MKGIYLLPAYTIPLAVAAGLFTAPLAGIAWAFQVSVDQVVPHRNADGSLTFETDEGSISYERMETRNGAVVMEDFHDSYEGKGWISGTVLKADKKSILVSVPKGKTKTCAVTLSVKTKVWIGGKAAANSLLSASSLKKDHRVSIQFQKGTHVAASMVDEGYEMEMRMTSLSGGSSGGPAMPHVPR